MKSNTNQKYSKSLSNKIPEVNLTSTLKQLKVSEKELFKNMQAEIDQNQTSIT